MQWDLFESEQGILYYDQGDGAGMITFLTVLQFFVLSLWVGSMFSFGLFFAPVLFRYVASRDQAGSIAGETLSRVDSFGLVTGGIMLVVTILQAIESAWLAIDFGRFVIAGVMLSLLLLSTLTIRPRMSAIRQQMGRPIDELDALDPLRTEHKRQHRLSRLIFTLNLVLGCLLILLSALRLDVRLGTL